MREPMEVRKRKTYETGFKRQVVAELELGKISLSGAAKKYEVSPVTLKNWQKKFTRADFRMAQPSARRNWRKSLNATRFYWQRLTQNVSL